MPFCHVGPLRPCERHYLEPGNDVVVVVAVVVDINVITVAKKVHGGRCGG